MILRDDKGQEMSVEGDWSGRLVGADFGHGGQILVWMQPGPDGYLQRVEQQPQIEHPLRPALEAAVDKHKPALDALAKGD